MGGELFSATSAKILPHWGSAAPAGGGSPPPPQAVPRPHGAEFGAGGNARYSPPRGGVAHRAVGCNENPTATRWGKGVDGDNIPTYEKTQNRELILGRADEFPPSECISTFIWMG